MLLKGGVLSSDSANNISINDSDFLEADAAIEGKILYIEYGLLNSVVIDNCQFQCESSYNYRQVMNTVNTSMAYQASALFFADAVFIQMLNSEISNCNFAKVGGALQLKSTNFFGSKLVFRSKFHFVSIFP